MFRLISVPLVELGGGKVRWEEAAGNRRVERGSRLVTAVPFHSRLIVKKSA